MTSYATAVELRARLATEPANLHPMVWTHLDGRKSLVLGTTAGRVVGMADDEGTQFLRDLLAAATPDDGAVTLLVAPMLQGNRELIAGLATDPQGAWFAVVGPR
mgnify:CR=1 FL=1